MKLSKEMRDQIKTGKFEKIHVRNWELLEAMLDQDIAIIIGGNGEGRTELFHSLYALPAIGRFGKKEWFDIEDTTWLLGMCIDPRAAERVMDDEWAAFWNGMLFMTMVAQEEETFTEWRRRLGKDLRCFKKLNIAEPGAWLPRVKEMREDVCEALDDLDTALEEANRTVIVIYDDLDKISKYDLAFPIRVLLGFWHHRLGRWGRIRPKILIRPDICTGAVRSVELFNHACTIEEVDA